MESITTATIREERPRRRSLKRQRTKRTAMTTAAAALMTLSCQTFCVEAFGSVTTSSSITRTSLLSVPTTRIPISPSSSPTSVYFTVDEYHASHATTTDNFFNNSPYFFRNQQKLHQLEQELTLNGASATFDDGFGMDTDERSEQKELPAWLRDDKSHLVQENMDKLRSAMLSSSSFFTETEAMKLTYAIQEAARNNNHKMAGAADFCLIMVETMEMGLNALVAAAFHYCECIDARERSIRTSHLDRTDGGDVDSLSHWEFRLPPLDMESFGDHAAKIERDAARLKRLEVVASMVVYNKNKKAGLRMAKKAADNLRNLYTTEAKDWRALAIRGAACLYRLRGILNEQSVQQKDGLAPVLTQEANRVCREAFRIYAPLASRMGMHRLKNELEHAAFQILYRRQYDTYESLLCQTRSSQSARKASRRRRHESESDVSSDEPNIGESMEEILAHVKGTMTEFLKNDAVFAASVTNFRVTARVKESYSTWKKMLRDGFDHISQVPDVLALRIVLDAKKESPDESDAVTRARERALCYYAQQLCQTVWAPYEGDPRFKDYIANPKENGYQSLHYTAGTKWNNEDWKMEIQVRTGEMHKVAEFGVASHWNYKAMAKPTRRSSNNHNGNAFSHNSRSETATSTETASASKVAHNHQSDPFGKVTIANNNERSDAYLRSLQEWHWEKQHGSSPVRQTPLVLWDNEAETRERAERIRARTQRLAPYLEALAHEKDDLQRKNVFVFLAPQQEQEHSTVSTNGYSLPTEGTVVALPAGASILDALRKCDLPILPGDNFYANHVVRNGTPASLTSRLQNGDVLSIPTVTACLTA